MTRKRRTILALSLAAGLWLQGATEVCATSTLHRNIVELTALSEQIVVGSIVSVSDGIENQIPYTEITIEVREALKGDWRGQITFRQFGLQKPRLMPAGQVNLNVSPQGWPRYQNNEEVILFLYKPAELTGLRTTTGLLQGKFNIEGDKLANAIDNVGLFRGVSEAPDSLTPAESDLLTIERGPVDVKAFVSLVRKIVRSGPASPGATSRERPHPRSSAGGRREGHRLVR